MAEKSAVLIRGAANEKMHLTATGIMWAACGVIMELGADAGTVGSAALAAGISGNAGLWICAGGAAGAFLHGIPGCLSGIVGLAMVLTGRLIPDIKRLWARCVIQGIISAAAAFFPVCAEYRQPSELLTGIISAITAGIFTVCVMLLYDRISVRGFDTADSGDCALAAAAVAVLFMTLGRLDYTVCNVGRLAAGFLVMTAIDRMGTAGGALSGLPAVFGLCASGGADMAGAGVVCIAAMLSACLGRYGRITRAVGFVFFGCCMTLAAGIYDGSWKILTELAIAGTAYAVIPAARIIPGGDSDQEGSAGQVMQERLCFAARAVSGVNNGLEAAAGTLERRYSVTLQEVADRAADKACRTCPNNMVCWGKKYELFHSEFSRLVKQLRCGGEFSEHSMSPEASAECIDHRAVTDSVRWAYERYLTASGGQQHIRELRRIYSSQLSTVSEILSDMGSLAGKIRSGSRIAERRAEKVLSGCGLKRPAAFVTFTRGGRLRLEAYGSGELNVDREYLGELLIRSLGRELDLPEVSGSGRIRITAAEKAMLSAETGSFQLNRGKNRVCGDCFESFTDPSGAFYIILSDGMGSGSRARIDSALACSMASRLIKSGISLSAALETVNTALMVKSSDESFATLDICRIDLNTGECVIYKAGAAVSYIKCSDKLLRASLSSPPAGSGGKFTVPAQKFHVSAGDMIIMTTDGAVLDDVWLSRELSRSDRGSPAELAERLARAARSADNGREDDITIIAVQIDR